MAIYEPNDLEANGISIKTNDDLRYALKRGMSITRLGRPAAVTAEDRIEYDGWFVTDNEPRRPQVH